MSAQKASSSTSPLPFPNNISRQTSALIMIGAYTCAFVIGYTAFKNLSHVKDKLLRTFISHVIMGTSLFPLSLAFQNVNLFDPLWFVGTLGITWFWYFDSGVQNYAAILAVIAVSSYSIKHFYSYFGPWTGLGQNEFRTVETREKMQGFVKTILYWIGFCLIGYHWFQTFTAFNGIAPLYYVFYKQENVNSVLVIIGFLVSMAGVLIEHFADEQLKQFRKLKTGGCIDIGLWRYSRHPNYVGDCTYWFGFYLMGLGCSKDAVWTCVGSIIIFSIFNFVTLPWMERHIQHKKGYSEYQKIVSRFMFWPRRKIETKKE